MSNYFNVPPANLDENIYFKKKVFESNELRLALIIYPSYFPEFQIGMTMQFGDVVVLYAGKDTYGFYMVQDIDAGAGYIYIGNIEHCLAIPNRYSNRELVGSGYWFYKAYRQTIPTFSGTAVKHYQWIKKNGEPATTNFEISYNRYLHKIQFAINGKVNSNAFLIGENSYKVETDDTGQVAHLVESLGLMDNEMLPDFYTPFLLFKQIADSILRDLLTFFKIGK